MSRAAHWSRIGERGSAWGLQFTFGLYRLLGHRAARALLYPVTAWFYLAAPTARAASRDYLNRLHRAGGLDHPPRRRDTFRHFFAFAEAALDKVAAWMGRIDPARVRFPNHAALDALRASGRGAVVIGSHLGNLEMARALANRLGERAINAIVYTDHALRFNALLERVNPGFAVNLIQVSQLGPQTAIDLSERIERGELLFIVGDRTPPADNGRVTRVDFLGDPAAFAHGPCVLASLLKCPVYLFFCLPDGERGWEVTFEPFAERIELPRARREEALRHSLERYAARLAHHCRRAPYQWFNFYDFWRP